MRLENDVWQDYFETFQHSAFRLETHPVYAVPGEDSTFQRFLSGERPTGEHAKEWTDKVRRYLSTNRSISRVHVVTRPLSDYLRYEFSWWYRFNAEAGEDIRILDVTDRPDLDLPGYDFYLFDESRVVKMLYRSDGTQTGRELLEDADPTEYIRYRDTAVRESVPFAEYVADRP
ncbi:DUF6879 family protein [Streptosporangium saharense]|uniref:DUF6879 family protein n=1 Tax=Streptosporangium saharense TaxID=1706840 RepID=UPI003676C7F4